ncbi:MAG: hypothetical protein J6L88_08085 [Clostridia bacterium]|nr:hypothetical protein [Clostridia bacterium]
MDLNHLVHLPLSDAVTLAQDQGYCVQIQQTAPPRGPIDGQERVVRVKLDGETLVLTTAFYVRAK